MKIAMMTNNYKPFIAGVPISIERLAVGLRKLGHEVYIFAPDYPQLNQEEEDGVIRYPALYQRKHDYAVVPNSFSPVIEAKIRELEIDLIHVHHPMLIGNKALAVGKKYSLPVVFTYHTKWEDYLHYFTPYGKLEKLSREEKNDTIKKLEENALIYCREKIVRNYLRHFSNRCQLLFAPTNCIKQHLNMQGVHTDIEILPTGLLDTSFEPEQEKADKIKAQYKLKDGYLFTSVSRLAKEKNIEFLLRGLKVFKETSGEKFRLLMIGDGPEREHLENYAGSLNLADEVCFLGNIANEEIKNYHAASDLFLFASKSETQGIVLLEAMAARNPVIAVEASGVSDLVENGFNGYRTNETETEWSSCILETLKNPSLHDWMREGAHETAAAYSQKKIALAAEAAYEQAFKMKYAQNPVLRQKFGI